MNVLKITLELLLESEELSKYANLTMQSHKADGLSADEKRLLTRLFYTVIENKITYDYYISKISARSSDDISPRAKNILRLGICQILNINSITDYTAVNECVKLAGSKGEKSFINGVLREFIRQRDNIPLPSREKSLKRYLSLKYSFPQPLVKHFINICGEDGAEALLSSFNTLKYTDICVNLSKISREEFLSRLLSAGYDAEPSARTPIGIRIHSSVNPCNVFGYDEGYFFVQDEASAILATLLSAEENMRICDVCAAPGGKSLAVASLIKDKGEILSLDLHKSKLSLIEDSAGRLGFSSIRVGEGDAREPKAELYEGFDRVICDVPCSGLGVLGKKADMRYKDLSRISELAKIQYEILSTSKNYLKRGGIMSYSTCTLNPVENEEIVLRFISENPDFSLVPFEICDLKGDGGMLTLYPHIHKTDGFFIALLKRN